MSTNINAGKLKQAIQRFGSLQDAVDSLQVQKTRLDTDSITLAKELEIKERRILERQNELKQLDKSIEKRTTELNEVLDDIKEYSNQYQLFESFMAMFLTSPSKKEDPEKLVHDVLVWSKAVWRTDWPPEKLRWLFVRVVLGEYLRCYHCNSCGAKFIVNKEPNNITKKYNCPSCIFSSSVEADESFLKAMISGKYIEDAHIMETLLKEIEKLKPLKTFQDIECEICKKPICDWTERNIAIAIKGYGWAHTKCWNSALGQMLLTAEMLGKIRNKK